MNDKKNKPMYQCPQCNSKQCQPQHAGLAENTIILCMDCGYQAKPVVFTKLHQKKMNLAGYTGVPGEAGLAGNNSGASDAPSPENDPTRLNSRDRAKKNRKRPERRLTETNPRNENPEVVLVAKLNHGGEIMKNPFVIESTSKSMTKIAREFEFSKWRELMKEKADNLVFPEGGLGKAKNNKGDNAPTTQGPYGNKNYFDYDIVDRKEMWKSPNPEDFIPGYKEWVEEQVDKYYDGWLDDHIENAGGEIVGSNTEKTMNLNDGERNHAPVYPTEANYEKLLENRHEFNDDYKTMVAETKAGIRKAFFNNPFVTKIAQFDPVDIDLDKPESTDNTSIVQQFKNDIFNAVRNGNSEGAAGLFNEFKSTVRNDGDAIQKLLNGLDPNTRHALMNHSSEDSPLVANKNNPFLLKVAEKNPFVVASNDCDCDPMVDEDCNCGKVKKKI